MFALDHPSLVLPVNSAMVQNMNLKLPLVAEKK